MRIKLTRPMTLCEIARATAAKIKKKNKYLSVGYLSTDSREVQPGDLFICLRGDKFDAENFAGEALKKGAVIISRQDHRNALLVEDTAAALMHLATYSKGLLKNLKKTVAVTGSVGKTTTKEFIKAIVGSERRLHATEGNLNNAIGVPLTLLGAPPDTEILVVEMGMNSLGEISELSRAVRPDVGVITCIGTAHIGRLGSRENIARAKLEILHGMNGGKLVVPGSEPLLSTVEPRFTFSAYPDISDCQIRRLNGNITFTIKGQRPISSSFSPRGEHNLKCLGAAVASCYASGIDLDTIKSGISRISDVNTRQKQIKIHGLNIIDDSYNASYESLIASFELMNEVCSHGKKSVVIGDILELGEEAESIYRRIGERLAGYNFKSIFLVGECSHVIMRALEKSTAFHGAIHINEDASHLDITVRQILESTEPAEYLLIKASHGIGLWRLAEILKKATEDKNG